MSVDRVVLYILMLIAAYQGYKYGMAVQHQREQAEAQAKYSLELNIASHSEHDVFGTLHYHMGTTPQEPRYCISLHNSWLPETLQVKPWWSLSKWLFEDQDTTTYCVPKADAKNLFGIIFCFILLVVQWPYIRYGAKAANSRKLKKESSKKKLRN